MLLVRSESAQTSCGIRINSDYNLIEMKVCILHGIHMDKHAESDYNIIKM